MSSFTFYQRAELTIHTENLLVECGPSDRPLACGHLAWWRGLQQPPMEKQTRADVLRPHVVPPPPRRKHTAGGVGDLFVSPTPPRKQNRMALIWVFLYVVIFHLANKMAVTFSGSVTL